MIGLKKKLAEFGLKKLTARRTQRWIQDRMGLVFGAAGRGGSGIFLELGDRQVALLTARHVVVGALCTGEITIGVCAREREPSFVPLAIKLHPELDAALLYVKERASISKFLMHHEWAANQPTVSKGMAIVNSGAPGLLKSNPDVAARTISTVKILHYFTTVTDHAEQTARGDFIACDIDETDPDVPSTIRGMSGGPAFTLKRRLIGTNTAERRHTDPTSGRIYVQRLDALQDLFVDRTLYPGRLLDYVGQREMFAFRLIDRTLTGARPFGVIVYCWYFRSDSRPDDREGRIGIIYRIGMTGEGGERVFPINVLARFQYGEDDLHQRADQLRLRVLRILGNDTYGVYEAPE